MNWLTRCWNWLRPHRRKQARRPAAPAVVVRTPARAPVAAPAGGDPLPRFVEPAAGGGFARPAFRGGDQRSKLSRAFTPAQPVSDLNRFSGREELVSRLIRAIENQKMHVVLYGDRGMGKTSMLHALAILAREARYLVRYTSCSEASDFDTSFHDVAKDIPLLYHGELDPTSVGDSSFADLFEERPISVNHLCEQFGKIRGARVLVIVDEFDRATAPGFRNAIAEMIKNLSDRGAPVQLVIGGVAGNLNELITFIPSIRRNLIGIPVTGMSPAELGQIIERGEKVSELRYPPAVRDTMVALAVGSPYLINLFAYEAGSRTLDREGAEVSPADLDDAAISIARDMRGRMELSAERQLDRLERGLSSTQIRDIAREAIGNFGRLSDESVAMLRAASPESIVVGGDGAVRFCDDAMPLILWLDGHRPA